MTISGRHEATTPAGATVTAAAAAVVVGLVLRLHWAGLIPFNGGPDEAHHFPMVQFIRDQGRLPTMADVPVGVPISYPALPAAGYAPGVLTTLAIGADHPVAYRIARLGNVAVGVLLIWAAYSATRLLAREQPQLAIVVAWLTALHPQLVFVASYVNNDAAAVVLGTLVLQQWLGLYRAGPSAARGAILGLTAAAALLCKLNTLGTVVAGLAVPFAAAPARAVLWSKRRNEPEASPALPSGNVARWSRCVAAAIAGGLLGIAPWCVWSLRQHGSLWGTDVHYQWWRRHVETLAQPTPLLDRHNAGQFIIDTWKSFWGAFGYCTVWLEPIDYVAVTVAMGIAAWAFVVSGCIDLCRGYRSRSVRKTGTDNRQPDLPHRCARKTVWILVAGVLLTIATHVYHSAVHGLAPQGRYLLPVAWPILFLLASGWGVVGRATGRKWLGTLVPILLMAWLQWSAIRAEWASLVVAQPDSQVRGQILAYGAPLPATRGDCPPVLQAVGESAIPLSDGTWQIADRGALIWKVAAPTAGVFSVSFDLYQAPRPGAFGTLVIESAAVPKWQQSVRLMPIEPSGVVRYSVDVQQETAQPGAILRFTLAPALGTAPSRLYRAALHVAERPEDGLHTKNAEDVVSK
jgi:hypothetical protein